MPLAGNRTSSLGWGQVHDQRVFRIAGSPDPRPTVHIDKEDAVREASDKIAGDTP